MSTAVSEPTSSSPTRLFWARYNARLEFPTSLALATLLITLMFLLLIALGLWAAWGRNPAPTMVIKLVEPGLDDDGGGSPGPAATDLSATLGLRTPANQNEREHPLELNLPKLKEQRDPSIPLEDPLKVTPLTERRVEQEVPVGDDVRRKLQHQGMPRGDAKTGPGGDGADTTRARSVRWVLRFKTTSGRDYLAQLKGLNAVVIVPINEDGSAAYIFKPKDLDNPKPGNLVTETEWKALSQQIQFCDVKKESAEAIGQALNLDFTTVAFWAFFPKELEADLARKEVAYRNRRPEDIGETVFQVVVRGNKYEMVVIEQKPKK